MFYFTYEFDNVKDVLLDFASARTLDIIIIFFKGFDMIACVYVCVCVCVYSDTQVGGSMLHSQNFTAYKIAYHNLGYKESSLAKEWV